MNTKTLAIVAISCSALAFAVNLYTVSKSSSGIDVQVEDGVAVQPKYLMPIFDVTTLDAVSLSILIETEKKSKESITERVKHSVRNAYTHAFYGDYDDAESKIISDLEAYQIGVVGIHVYRNVETFEFKAVDLP